MISEEMWAVQLSLFSKVIPRNLKENYQITSTTYLKITASSNVYSVDFN